MPDRINADPYEPPVGKISFHENTLFFLNPSACQQAMRHPFSLISSIFKLTHRKRPKDLLLSIAYFAIWCYLVQFGAALSRYFKMISLELLELLDLALQLSVGS